MKNGFLIAAPSSNSGKTVITMGLIRALKGTGLNVQPFKCGPDYIDPLHHTQIAGRQSYNLDVWMSDEKHIKNLFNSKMQSADVAVVEGVMGLFDGAKRDKGSSAEIARIIKLPVILVVNAAATAYSVAPLLYGFKNFNREVDVKGVIFNKVSGESHYRFLKEAADDAGVVSLGYVPKNEELVLESRHLGLSLTGKETLENAVNKAADLIRKHIDLGLLMKITQKKIEPEKDQTRCVKSGICVGVARDEAFNFMYPANIDSIEQIGEVKYFSPLNDKDIPDCDVLWFPGGYPELYAQPLSENHAMLRAIAEFEKQGGKIIAECGGMMYLGKSVEVSDGVCYPMVGVFDYETSLLNMKLKLGYRTVEIDGEVFKGHEFHYSMIKKDCSEKAKATSKTARGIITEMPIYRNDNCWSSYFHVYLGEEYSARKFLKLFDLGV